MDWEPSIRHAVESVPPVIDAPLSRIVISSVLVRDLADLYRGELMAHPVTLRIPLSHQIDVEIRALLPKPSALVLP